MNWLRRLWKRIKWSGRFRQIMTAIGRLICGNKKLRDRLTIVEEEVTEISIRADLRHVGVTDEVIDHHIDAVRRGDYDA